MTGTRARPRSRARARKREWPWAAIALAVRGRPRALLGRTGRLRRDPQLHPPAVLERAVRPADRLRPARAGTSTRRASSATPSTSSTRSGCACSSPATSSSSSRRARSWPRSRVVLIGLRLAPRALPSLDRATRWLVLLRLPLQLRLPEHDGLALPGHEAARRPAAPGPAAASWWPSTAAPARATRGVRGRLRDRARHEPPRPAGPVLRARPRRLPRPGLGPTRVAGSPSRSARRRGAWSGRRTTTPSGRGSSTPSTATGPSSASSACARPGCCSRTPGSRPSTCSATGRRCSSAASRRSLLAAAAAAGGRAPGRGAARHRRGRLALALALGGRGPGRAGRDGGDHGAAARAGDVGRPPPLVLPPSLPGAARLRPARRALDRLAARGAGALPRSVPLALGALVVANVAQWPEKRLVMQSEPAFAEELRGSLLLGAVARGGHADPALAGDHRRFYFECLDRFPRIAARARPQVSEGEGVFRPEIRGGRLVARAGARGPSGREDEGGRTLRPRRPRAAATGGRDHRPRRLAAAAPRRGSGAPRPGRGGRGLPRGRRPARRRERGPPALLPARGPPSGRAAGHVAFALLLPVTARGRSRETRCHLRAPSAIVPAGRAPVPWPPPCRKDSTRDQRLRVQRNPPRPPPVNEPVKAYAPGFAGAGRAQGAARGDGRRADRDPARHRREGGPERRDGEGGHAPRPRPRPRRLAQGLEGARRAGDRGGGRGPPRVGELAVGGPRRRLPPGGRAARHDWRATLNAATMLGQSKTAFQAEIDSAAELIDFWRFNPHYAQELYAEQPLSSGAMWNQLDYRPLEGFVYAVTPFNFTSIAGNLPTSPALMGNAVLWKPASSAIPSAYYILQAPRGGGPAPGRHQLRARQRRGHLRRRPQPPRPRRRPLHRVDRGLQLDVADDRRRHGPLPLVPADRGRDRGQGLHRGPPVGRPAGLRGRRRPRRLRVPGPEVLGREPHLRAPLDLEGRPRPDRRA